MRRVKVLAVAVSAAVLSFLVAPGAAFALATSPDSSPIASPDSRGKYGYCNINVWGVSGGSALYAYAACIFSPTTTGATTGTNQPGAIQLSYTNGVQASTLSTWTTVTNAVSGRRMFAFNGAQTTNAVALGYELVCCASGQAEWINTITRSGGVDGRVNTGSVIGVQPSYPDGYFGGGSPPPTVLTGPTSTGCSRTLSGTSDMVSQFKANPSPRAMETATGYSWSWGDGGAASIAQNSSHTYPAVGTMPAGGWTAVVTVTYTASAGFTYAGGAATATATCSLRVDFLNPSQTVAASTGTEEDAGDPGLASCLPSGWGFLNPLAYVRGMACVLQWAFVPSGEPFGGLVSAYEGSLVETLTRPATVLAGMFTALRTGSQENDHEGSGTCQGPSADVPLGQNNSTFKVRPLEACSGPTQTVATAVRGFLVAVFYVLTALGLARVVGKAFGVEFGSEGRTA